MQKTILYIIMSSVILIHGSFQIKGNNFVIPAKDSDIIAFPNPMEFEDTYVGEFTQQLLTVENTGISTLEVTSVSTTDPAFLLSVNPFDLEPGETQSFIVRFQPIVAGYNEGFVQITNNSSINPYEVPLSGTGLAPVPAISASPNPLVFDNTYIASSTQKNLYITNSGLATLTITDFIFSNPIFETYNNPPISLEPGETHNMVVHFKPFELGLFESSVQLISNDPDNPSYEVQITGTCINDPINGWEWHYTGYDYIFYDISFPDGQSQIGYAVGATSTYDGDGVILKTTDGGDTWSQISQGIIPGLEAVCFTDENTGYAGGWQNYFIKTTDGGVTWTESEISSTIYFIKEIDFWDDDNGIVSAWGGEVYVTDDAGLSWIQAIGVDTDVEDLVYAEENIVYAAGGDEKIIKSSDGGLNWSEIYVGNFATYFLGIDFYNENYGIVGGEDGKVLITNDGGSTWDTDMTSGYHLWHGVYCFNEDSSYVSGTPEGIYKTNDGGTNWINNFNGNYGIALYKILFTEDNYTGFVSGSSGVILRKPGIELTPEISTSPESIEYEDTYVGQFVQTLLTVENTGTSTLEVTNVTTTDPVFIEAASSFSLEPGETQNFIVRFQPITAGLVEGFVEIENNSSINPFQVPLSGTGLEPVPVISASPDPLVFDNTYIASSTQKNLYITNSGLTTLTITDFIFPNSTFETYNNPPITLEPGETHDMVIHFKPLELGLIVGSVQFISNDPVNPTYEVQLNGTCIDDPINGWEWLYTGLGYSYTDIEFPEGQNQIGYVTGQTASYNGVGIVAKTTDGGDTWSQLTPEGIPGLLALSFPTMDVGYATGWDGYLIKTIDGGQNWDTIAIDNSIWLINDIEFWDENTGIVLNSGEISYVTNDGGQSWTETIGITTNGYRVSYADENTLYIAANENYIFKSIDGGVNWTTLNSGNIGELLLGTDFLNADYGYAVGDYGIILKTDNGGTTWDQQFINDILFTGAFVWDSDTAYAVGTPEFIYKTTDGGVSWNSDFNGSYQLGISSILFTDNYTGYAALNNGVILRKAGIEIAPEITTNPEFIDFEDTYVGEFVQTLLTVENTGTSTLDVTNVSTTDPAFIEAATSFSLEPGETQSFIVRYQPLEVGLVEGFVEIENNSSINPFQVPLSGTGLEPSPTISAIANPLVFNNTYIGSSTQQNLYISNTGLTTLIITDFIFSSDTFETYNNPPITLEPGEVHDMVIHFKPFELGYQEGSVQFVSNDLNNPMYEVQLQGTGIDDPVNGWEWHYTGFNYILMDIAFPEGQNQIGYCAGQSLTYNGEGVVIKTSDGGDTWEQMTTGAIDGLQGCSFVSIDTGYAAGWNGYIIKTTDGGETWDELFIAGDIFEITDIEFYDADNGVVVGQDNDGAFAYVTDDGGETWIAGTGIESACYRLTYADAHTLFIAANNGFIFKSTDNGYNWSNVSTGSGLMLGLDFLNADYGIVTGDNGLIMKTTDGGNSWETQVVNDNLFHGVFVWDQDTSWIVGTPDLVYKSIDGGVTYTSQYPSYSAWKALYNIVFTDNYTGFICGGSNGIVLRKQGLEMVPAISVTPASVGFPDTFVGESATSTVTISNTGLAALDIIDIISTNDVFSVDMTSFLVEPGNSQDIEITFTPDNEANYTGLLQIESNDLIAGTIEVNLTGSGIFPFPIININPMEIVFDTTLIGGFSEATITITNNGNADLNVNSITSSNIVFTSNISSTILEPGLSEVVTVTFTPDEEMWYQGILSLESNDSQTGTVEVELSGYGYIITSVGDLAITNDVIAYPNPAKNYISLDNVNDSHIYLFDLAGNIILDQRSSENKLRLYVSDLNSGTYILKVIKKRGVYVKKIELIK